MLVVRVVVRGAHLNGVFRSYGKRLDRFVVCVCVCLSVVALAVVKGSLNASHNKY